MCEVIKTICVRAYTNKTINPCIKNKKKLARYNPCLTYIGNETNVAKS